MKNLIGMTDFVLDTKYLTFEKITNYANFLKQPLELWMFVPCDGDGNVLEEPKDEDLCKYCSYDESKRGASAFSSGCEGSRCDSAADYFMEIFEQAKERCLFSIHKLFEETDDSWYFGVDEFSLICVEKSDTIEDLIKYNLQLTPTAIK